MKGINAKTFLELGQKMNPEDWSEVTKEVGTDPIKGSLIKDRRKVYYAVHQTEIVKCHLIAKKDRDGRGAYAANSKRDKRRFQVAYEDYNVARDKAIEYGRRYEPDFVWRKSQTNKNV